METIIADQLKKHLNKNKIIPFQHNSGLQDKSTVTTALTLIDMWSKIMEEKTDAVCIQLDQTAAFEVIDNKLMIEKMKVIGANKNTVNWFTSYMKDRRQTTMLEGSISSETTMGPYGMIQGSILASLMYLIYILDFPLLFHSKKHNPVEDTKCAEPTALTYVDDINNTIKSTKK